MFPTLTGNGRIWIYVANRPLTETESLTIQERLSVFCENWAAHGNQLTAEFVIFHNQLLVLGVDEEVEAASGCSIDQTYAIFRQIDKEMNLDLFNRMNLAFLDEDKVRLVQLPEITQAFRVGIIHPQSTFLDNTIGVLSDLRIRWQVPFEKSWAFKRVKSLESS